MEVLIANNLDTNLNETIEMNEDVVDFKKDKSRANKRRLDRIKEERKKTQQVYIHNDKICPAEKRIRKRKGVRKVRHNDDVGQFGIYKKHCDISV